MPGTLAIRLVKINVVSRRAYRLGMRDVSQPGRIDCSRQLLPQDIYSVCLAYVSLPPSSPILQGIGTVVEDRLRKKHNYFES